MESLYLMPFAIFHIFPIRHGPGTSVFTALGCMDLRAPKLFAMLLEHHHPKKKDKVTFFFQLCQEYLDSAFRVHQEDCLYTYFSLFFHFLFWQSLLSASFPSPNQTKSHWAQCDPAWKKLGTWSPWCVSGVSGVGASMPKHLMHPKRQNAKQTIFSDFFIFRYFLCFFSFLGLQKPMQHKDTSKMSKCGTHH